MYLVRWIFFGPLDRGLERYVLLNSAVIALGSYLLGYYVAAFGPYFLDPDTAIRYGTLTVTMLVCGTFHRKVGFRMLQSVVLGIGAGLVFQAGAFGFEPHVVRTLLGIYLVVRCFALGPKHLQPI
ncbi:MAG: hypothetical protein P4L81_01895 [Candidatus Pacebacteria bacterium]|nr:hypothetical protein [Candidatus Paceibacterota bacterium]